MELPNADLARVPRAKVVDYLLNRNHPDGASKAAFFGHFGFSVDAWQTLAESLHRLAQTGTVVRAMETIHGAKYIIDGPIATPSGREIRVRSVWIIDAGELAPRLVTAHPGA